MSFENTKNLTMTQLFVLAKQVQYVPPSYPLNEWTTEDIYFGALKETIESQYQVMASEIVCGTFPPLKLLLKKTLRNYIKIMLERLHNANANELSA